jgi:hypothetical protein
MSFRSQEPQRRTGGPIGGLVKLIGTGVGAAVEYHGHRKQRKAAYDSAQASPEEEHVSAGPSSQPTTIQRSTSNNLPPTYTQSTNHTSDGQLATGPPAIDEKKLQDDSSSDSEYLSDELTPIEDDEEAWQLDEVGASTEPPSYENATRETTDAFERDIVATRELNTSPIGTLLLPVIVPQRRPRNKSRGFVRAYSPVLEDVGIDQKTFLRFLKNFHSSSQANPCFSAVMVAAGIVGMVPEPIIMAVTISVQVVAGTLKELDSRRKTNNFLDRMNETLFKPAGCYAFIMKYKPDAEVKQPGGLLAKLGVKIEDVDFSASKTVAKYDAPSAEEGTSMATRLKKIRLTSGQTKGSVKMVEAAPLIYPEIDEIVYSGKDGQETFKDKAKDASKFLAGYADRRAQMQYVSSKPFQTAHLLHGLTRTCRLDMTPTLLWSSQRASVKSSLNGRIQTIPCLPVVSLAWYRAATSMPANTEPKSANGRSSAKNSAVNAKNSAMNVRAFARNADVARGRATRTHRRSQVVEKSYRQRTRCLLSSRARTTSAAGQEEEDMPVTERHFVQEDLAVLLVRSRRSCKRMCYI